jgi:hypothetical protein
MYRVVKGANCFCKLIDSRPCAGLMIYPVIVGTKFVNPSSVTHDNHYPMLRFKSLICLIKIRCKNRSVAAVFS